MNLYEWIFEHYFVRTRSILNLLILFLLILTPCISKAAAALLACFETLWIRTLSKIYCKNSQRFDLSNLLFEKFLSAQVIKKAQVRLTDTSQNRTPPDKLLQNHPFTHYTSKKHFLIFQGKVNSRKNKLFDVLKIPWKIKKA